MGSVELPYLQRKVNAQGRAYWFYRRAGRYVRLPGAPGSAEWLAAYWRERSRDDPKKEAKPTSRTFKRLVQAYYQTVTFKNLAISTQRTYRASFNEFLEKHGELSVAGMRFRHVNKLIGDMHDRPGAANKMLKRLRALFLLARQLEWVDRDPTEGVAFYKLGEIHTWTDEEIAQFAKHHGPGSVARLGFMLQLCTGQRNSDVVTQPWPRDGKIRVVQEKTGAKLWIPVAQELDEELAHHKRDHALILTTLAGKPRSVAGYGNMMRAAIDRAKLPKRCVPHGLRKAAAKHLAEAGCTTKEIMAITGHTSLGEVERYTRAADQERLAEQAAAKRSRNKRLGTTPDEIGNELDKLIKSAPYGRGGGPGGTRTPNQAVMSRRL